MILKSDAKFEEKLIFLFQKWQEFGEFCYKHSKFPKISTLIVSFCSKYRMLDLRKYRNVIFYDTEEWFKIW